MTQVTSRTFVDLAGLGRLRTKPGTKINMGGVTRKASVGDDSVHGYQEELVPPSIDTTVVHAKDLSLATLQGITNETVTATTDTGKVYVLQEAWVENAIELNDGNIALRFVGKRMDEVT